jgi:hypothetical protein
VLIAECGRGGQQQGYFLVDTVNQGVAFCGGKRFLLQSLIENHRNMRLHEVSFTCERLPEY